MQWSKWTVLLAIICTVTASPVTASPASARQWSWLTSELIKYQFIGGVYPHFIVKRIGSVRRRTGVYQIYYFEHDDPHPPYHGRQLVIAVKGRRTFIGAAEVGNEPIGVTHKCLLFRVHRKTFCDMPFPPDWPREGVRPWGAE